MRRIISILTALLICVTLCSSAFAVEPYGETGNPVKTKTINAEGYSFQITEQVTSDNQVIRTYNGPITDVNAAVTASTSSDRASTDMTKALLAALGWEQAFIDDLSEESLQEYASGKQITTTVSYVREDAQGNVTYLSEQDALQETAVLSAAPEEDNEITTTSYMRFVHTVTYYGDALYRFSSDARWLTMPTFRFTDSIGSCAPTLAIDNSSRKGQISYTVAHGNTKSGLHIEETVTKEITNVKNAQNGDWYGSAGLFNLPNDSIYAVYSYIRHSNFRAHYEFKAYLRYPSLETNFNSVGSYCHLQVSPSIFPSISIEKKSSTSASIGISVVLKEDRVLAELLMHYVPD